MHQQLSRRNVLKTILVTSACSIIQNKLWAGKVISEVTANEIDPTVGVARVLLSSFPALANIGGSVRLGSSSINGDLPLGLWYPIIISRVSATEFTAAESACLHEGAVIGALSPANITTGRMTCPRHSAQYDIRGVCTRNPNVASGYIGRSLLTYATTLSGAVLSINVVDQGFTVTQQTVLNGTEKRLELSWDAFDRVEYEVRYRPNFQTEPVRVNCSLTPTGTITSTFVPGLVNGGTRRAYVVPQDGIYQIAIRMRAV